MSAAKDFCTESNATSAKCTQKCSQWRSLIFVAIFAMFSAFKEADDNVSGDSYVTVSLVIPMISMINTKLKEANMDTADGILTKYTLLQISQKRLSGLLQNNILMKAT